MGFLGLCSGDELLEMLREQFSANPLRIPEERVKPMRVLAGYDGKVSFRGELVHLVKGEPALTFPEEDFATSRMADVSGKKSRSVKLELGLEVLSGFLKGFGIPPAQVATAFEGASEVAFSFKDVSRKWVDVGAVGNQMAGRHLNEENPAGKIFLSEEYAFLLIESTITSSDFSMSVEKARSDDFEINMSLVKDIVGEAGAAVEVRSTSKRDVTFKGKEALPFAFTCCRIYLDENHRFDSIPPESDVRALTRMYKAAEVSGRDVGSLEGRIKTLEAFKGDIPNLNERIQSLQPPRYKVAYSPDRVLLTDEPALLEWDDD
jgi:hypothetical protein